MSSHDDRPHFAKIPPEMISEIFIRCLPVYPSPPSAETAPLLLLQICTLWRDIALDTPDLWSNVVLTDDSKDSVDMLHLWSARARTIPMTFSLKTHNVEMGQKMLFAAMKHTERWEHVDLCLPYVVVGGVSGASLPYLRHLSLDVRLHVLMDGFIDPDVGPLPRLDLSGASQLRELHLAAYPYTLLYGVPLGQLTTLRMDGRGLAEDLTILRSCKSLVKLTLRKGDPELNLILPSSPEVVHLPHLESLVVTSSSIFKYLFLPLLRRLQFPLTRKGVADLLPLIAKWGCTLESLVVALGNPYDILRQLLAATPSLKELHLDFSLARSNWTTTVLRNTNVLPTTVEMLDVDDIVPQLEALRITWYAYAQYIPRELKSFLRKKALESKSGGVFKSFTLMLPHCMEELVGSSLVGELKVLSDNEFKADIVTRANASQ